MSDADQAIAEAQCIVWMHQHTLWMREHPKEMAEIQAVVDAWTPAQRLAWIEAMDDIRRMLNDLGYLQGGE